MRFRGILFSTVSILVALAVGSTPALADTDYPDCNVSIVGTGQSGLVDVEVLDRGSGNTGIASIELDVDDPDFSNIQCTMADSTDCTAFAFDGNLPNRANFSLSLVDISDPLVGGQGRATVTDGAGLICTVSVSYVHVPAGPVSNIALLVDKVQASKLFVLSGDSVAAEMAITSSVQPPSEDDLDCLPLGFDYDPDAVVIALHGKRLRGADAYAMVALFGGSMVLAVTVFGGARMRSWLFEDTSTGLFIVKSVPCAIFAVIGAYAVARIWRRLGSKPALRINQRGVQFVDPSLPGELIPWDRIAEAEYLEDGDEFVIRGESGEALVTCPTKIIGGRSNVELCARQVNALRDKYHDRA